MAAAIPKEDYTPEKFMTGLTEEIGFNKLISKYQVGGAYAHSFLNEYYDEMMVAFSKLIETNFSELNEIIIAKEVKEEEDGAAEQSQYQKFTSFLNTSGEYFTAKNALHSYMNKLQEMHNHFSQMNEQKDITKISPKRVPWNQFSPGNLSPATLLQQGFTRFLNANLPKMTKLIPTKTIHFSYKKIFSDAKIVKVKDNIIIVPGSADPYQSQERVNALIDLLTTRAIVPETVKYIIFTGRGNDSNMSGEYVKESEEKQFKSGRFYDGKQGYEGDTLEANPQELAMFNTIKYPTESRVEGFPGHGMKFKTEAFYMAEFFCQTLNKVDEPLLAKLRPQIRLESMALETAANFILAPYSIAYSVVPTEDSIEVRYNPEELTDDNLAKTLIDLHQLDLHVISSDFHILRCAINCLQTYRSSCIQCKDGKDTVTQFGDTFFYPVKADTPLMAENYFSSFYQPNFQMFFRNIDCPDIGLVQGETYRISKTANITCTTPLVLHKKYLLRLLMDHGLYANISNLRNSRFLGRLFKLYGIDTFFQPIPEILGKPLPRASGGGRRTQKRKQKNSQKKHHQTAKKLKKKKSH